MSASEPAKQASGPQSVEERLGESMIPLTQLGLTTRWCRMSRTDPPASTAQPTCTYRLRLDRCCQVLGPLTMTVILNVKLKVLLNVMNRQLHLAQTQLRLENSRLRLACLYVLYNQLRLDRQLHLAM